MNKPFLRYLLLVLLPALSLLSCDHRVVDPSTAAHPLGPFRLRYVTYNGRTMNGFTSDSRTFSLAYDSNGVLISYGYAYKALPNSIYYRAVVFERDAQGRVTKLTDGFQSLVYSYSGNRISQVSTIARIENLNDYTKSKDSLVRRYGYVYTSQQGLLPARRGYLESQLGINNAEEGYTFVNGNAVTINQTNYTYDDKPNPYYGMVGFNAFDPFDSNPQLERPAGTPFDNSDKFADIQVKVFNRNNITNNTKQITYNADGLVTRIEYTNGNTEEFVYKRL